MAGNQLQWTFSNSEGLVLFVAGGSEGPQVGRWIPQCFLEHYSCYDTDRTAETTDAPTSEGKGGDKSKNTPESLGRGG